VVDELLKNATASSKEAYI